MGKILLIVVLVSCTLAFGQTKVKLNDASLKIDVTKANDTCSCNGVVIAIMKERIEILTKRKEKRYKKLSEFFWEELMKREIKYQEFYHHCMPIYKVQGWGEGCANYKELVELDDQFTKLRYE